MFIAVARSTVGVSLELLKAAVACRLSIASHVVPGYPPAPPCPLSWHRLVQTRRPHVSALLVLFWKHGFGDSNPIENVVESFVQAAGRVNMGVKEGILAPWASRAKFQRSLSHLEPLGGMCLY